MALTIKLTAQNRLLVWGVVALSFLLISPVVFAKGNKALILTAKGDAFEQVISGIKGDIEEDELSFQTVEIEKTTSVKEIEAAIKKTAPKVILLIGNSSINLYTQYQESNPGATFPPSIALAALFVDKFISNIKNASGIRYEIPAVISLVNMRSIIKSPIKSVGVIHREWMSSLIEENRKYLEAEGIKLVAVELPNKDSNINQKLESGLQQLKNKSVDAIWVLNDNEILNGKSIGQIWIPQLSKTDIPVLVGVKPLLNTKYNFGTFAIVPDHYALGVQAASILYELMDENWEMGDRDITQPISVKKIVNVSVLDNKSIPYHKSKLQEVDEVIK